MGPDGGLLDILSNFTMKVCLRNEVIVNESVIWVFWYIYMSVELDTN